MILLIKAVLFIITWLAAGFVSCILFEGELEIRGINLSKKVKRHYFKILVIFGIISLVWATYNMVKLLRKQ